MSVIIAKDETIISADPSTVWRRLTDISNWGKWTRLIKHAAVYGPIKSGTELKFDSDKWDFSGTIIEVEPERLLVIKAKTIGITVESRCELAPLDSSTTVTMTLSACGWLTSLYRGRIHRGLEDWLFTWLYALKVSTEREAGKSGPIERPAHLMRPPKRSFSVPGPLNIFFKGHKKTGEDSE